MKVIITATIILCLFGCSRADQETTPKEEFKSKIDIDLQWGGYYASKADDKEQYGVFRLLDFNRNSYHVAIYKEKFNELPKLNDVMELSPYIGHAPIDSKALLRKKEIHLLGNVPLTEDDLEGYHFYLDQQDVKDEEIEALFRNIMDFGKQPPLKLTLKLKDDELKILERLH